MKVSRVGCIKTYYLAQGIPLLQKALLRNKADFNSLGKAILKKVIGKLINCNGLWCLISIKNTRGYVLKKDIWGVIVD